MGYDRLWCGPHCHLQQGDGGGEGGHGGGRGVGAGAGGGARVRHARGQRGAHRARAFTWVVRKYHPVYTTVVVVFMKVLGLRRFNRQKWIVIIA